MIQMIKECRELNACITWEISDAGLTVDVDPDLKEDEYVGIKVDDYYNHKKSSDAPTPLSVDYVISVDCACDTYVLYILELKNVKSPQSYTTKEITAKFETTIENFLKTEFGDIFDNARFKYRNIYLYLVTSAYSNRVKNESFEAYIKLLEKINSKDTLVKDQELSLKLFRFHGKILRIKIEVPPYPIIRKETGAK